MGTAKLSLYDNLNNNHCHINTWYLSRIENLIFILNIRIIYRDSHIDVVGIATAYICGCYSYL